MIYLQPDSKKFVNIIYCKICLIIGIISFVICLVAEIIKTYRKF